MVSPTYFLVLAMFPTNRFQVCRSPPRMAKRLLKATVVCRVILAVRPALRCLGMDLPRVSRASDRALTGCPLSMGYLALALRVLCRPVVPPQARLPLVAAHSLTREPLPLAPALPLVRLLRQRLCRRQTSRG